MRITKCFLEEEKAKISTLLSTVDVRADVKEEDGDIFMSLTDLQGAPVSDMEVRHFYYAGEILDAMGSYFDAIYLNGDVCCNANRDFKSYKEAEAYARKTGYTFEAGQIASLIHIQSSEKNLQVFGDDGDVKYILSREEIKAAYQYQQFSFYVEDMEDIFNTIIYDRFSDKGIVIEEEMAEALFLEEFGITAGEALELTKKAAKSFVDNFNADESEYDQEMHWATETIRTYAEEKSKESPDPTPSPTITSFYAVAKTLFYHECKDIHEVFDSCDGILSPTIGIILSGSLRLPVITDGKVDSEFYRKAPEYSGVEGFKGAVMEIMEYTFGLED